MPSISIIIPVYNTENFLSQCLESIIIQSFSDFEVICINDGSTDDSLKILEEYKKRDSRIKIISKANEGQGIARNVGLQNAEGKYILFLDSDDWLEKDALSILYNEMEISDADILFFNVYNYSEINKQRTEYSYASPYLNLFGENVFLPEKAKERLFIPPSYPFKIYKKSTLDELNYHYSNGTFWEDHLPHFMILSQAKKLKAIDKYVYNYRIHSSSSTANAVTQASTILENFCVCEKELEKYSNWHIFRPYFIQRKIKVTLNYFGRFSYSDKFIWYENMQNLFRYINKNYKKDLKQVDFDKFLFVCSCYLPFKIFMLIYRITLIMKIIKIQGI